MTTAVAMYRHPTSRQNRIPCNWSPRNSCVGLVGPTPEAIAVFPAAGVLALMSVDLLESTRSAELDEGEHAGQDEQDH